MTHVAFASVPVLDLDRAIAFWCDVMGAALTYDAPVSAEPGAMRWVMVQFPGARTQLQLNPVDALPVTDRPVLPLVVDDVEAEATRLSALGVEIMTPPGPAPWDPQSLYAQIRDSEGAAIVLASR